VPAEPAWLEIASKKQHRLRTARELKTGDECDQREAVHIEAARGVARLDNGVAQDPPQ
jgi:hypothetical protein